jgi:hypothetical protein
MARDRVALGACRRRQRMSHHEGRIIVMQVFTPADVAKRAANKYLGVLIAAKYSRLLNEFPRTNAEQKKLTTRSLEELTSEDGIKYRVVPRRGH